MKLTICGSMSAAKEMVDTENRLKALGHTVELPQDVTAAAHGATEKDPIQKKIAQNLIRQHYEKIKRSDAVLIINIEKKGIKGYIGGNTFMEMGFAFVLHKPIYLSNEIPEVSYRDEIEAMQPTVLNGDLAHIA